MKSRVASILTFVVALGLRAAAPAPLPASTPWDLAQLKQTPSFRWTNTESQVKSLIYKGLHYQDHVSEVFAYYATPTDFGFKEDKYPAMVLVHGGGGAAYEKWARLWASKGYIAIAMDLAGKGANRIDLPEGGPDQEHEQKFATIDEPLTSQWSYHAVANVLLAHSLVLSLDEVDPERTGVTGISWGGYLTCIVAGVDDRFQFAMPVYGCGYLRDNSAWKDSEFGKMSEAQSDRWHQLWDPSQYLASASMPVVFLNGTNDFAYPADSYRRSCELVRTEKNYSIQIRMKHGHLFDFSEFFLFADQYLKGGIPMPVVSTPTISDGKIRASVASQTRLDTARLHYTSGPHSENRERPWITQSLSIDGNHIVGDAPPSEATAYYIDLRDERNALVSSQFMTR